MKTNYRAWDGQRSGTGNVPYRIVTIVVGYIAATGQIYGGIY